MPLTNRNTVPSPICYALYARQKLSSLPHAIHIRAGLLFGDGIDSILCRACQLAPGWFEEWMKRKTEAWRNGCFEKNGWSSKTTPNKEPPKMDVLPKTFLQIILVTKWLVRHSCSQRRPLPSLLSDSLVVWCRVRSMTGRGLTSGPAGSSCTPCWWAHSPSTTTTWDSSWRRWVKQINDIARYTIGLSSFLLQNYAFHHKTSQDNCCNMSKLPYN